MTMLQGNVGVIKCRILIFFFDIGRYTFIILLTYVLLNSLNICLKHSSNPLMIQSFASRDYNRSKQPFTFKTKCLLWTEITAILKWIRCLLSHLNAKVRSN